MRGREDVRTEVVKQSPTGTIVAVWAEVEATGIAHLISNFLKARSHVLGDEGREDEPDIRPADGGTLGKLENKANTKNTVPAPVLQKMRCCRCSGWDGSVLAQPTGDGTLQGYRVCLWASAEGQHLDPEAGSGHSAPR